MVLPNFSYVVSAAVYKVFSEGYRLDEYGDDEDPSRTEVWVSEPNGQHRLFDEEFKDHLDAIDEDDEDGA